MSDTRDSDNGFVRSCGNVFADMGLEDAAELMARARRDHAARKLLKDKRLEQREIADRSSPGRNRAGC